MFIKWSLFILLLSTATVWGQGYSWKDCEATIWGGTTFPFTMELAIRPECVPDTLYSWTPLNRIEQTLTQRRENQLYPVSGNLYLWRTPLMSYGYGETVLRFKLRSQVKFHPLIMKPGNNSQRFCSELRRQHGRKVDETVYVAWFQWNPGYHEYILCSDGPVASISYGTSELLQEVMREKEWVETHLAGEFDLLHRTMGVSWLKRETNYQFDGGEWSHEGLRAKIRMLEDLSSRKAGAVITRPGDSAEEHYQTTMPNYFNP